MEVISYWATMIPTAIFGILAIVIQGTAATSKNSGSRAKPCHFKYPEAEAISSQLRLLTEMYLGHASLYSESILGFRDGPRHSECEPKYFFEISSDIRILMSKSWKIALEPGEIDDTSVEEIRSLLNSVASQVRNLSFTNRYLEVYTLKPSVLIESFRTGLRRIRAAEAARKKAEEEKNALTMQYQQIQGNLSVLLSRLPVPGNTELTSTEVAISVTESTDLVPSSTSTEDPNPTTTSTEQPIPSSTSTEASNPTTTSTPETISTTTSTSSTEEPISSSTSTPETIPTTSSTEGPTSTATPMPPAFNLDSRIRQAFQESYPSCSNPSDLTSTSRLATSFSLAQDPTYEGLSEPAMYNAILDAILAPSPMVCTQDYVRLAHRVQSRQAESTSAEDGKNWAWLRARFQPSVFQLLDSITKTRIISVSQPGYALSATTVRIPKSKPGNFAVVLKPNDPLESSFEFRLYSDGLWDGGFFLLENHLTNTYFHLFHMRRWVDTNAHMVLLPTEEFVLGKTATLQFRIGRKDGPVCKVAPPGSGYWSLGDRLERGSFLLASAVGSEILSVDTLFHLA